jgi:glycosidase
MPISTDILTRRTQGFVLWSPRQQTRPPRLVIGQLIPGNPPTIQQVQRLDCPPVAGSQGLWAVAAADCGLTAGTVYHYWFEVDDSRSSAQPPARIQVTDPFACCVDWRAFPPGASDSTQPAGVVKFVNGQLVDCDPGGEVADLTGDAAANTLPTNNHLVIYELPTAWAMSRGLNQPERDVGTFLDSAALVDKNLGGANFSDLAILAQGRSYLTELGINALELLPPADSFFKREWGYDTAHYLAPDYDLGYPAGNLSPTANRDLAVLVQSCHRAGIRVFVDMVMAFAHEEPYNHIDAPDFLIDEPAKDPNDPDAMTSGRSDGSRTIRDGFGSTLWRYAKQVRAYDPISGQTRDIYPARQLMLTHLARWMRDFHVDGLRLDSVENVANWDFLQTFSQTAREHWNRRWQDQGLGAGADERFLVVGEELSLPMALIHPPKRLDGLWNDAFQQRVRAAILGENSGDDPNFELTVKRAINCRLLGFADGADAVNYVTKHDVEGVRHERLFTMLRQFPEEQIEKRIKLAFACLLTAVGIPMILAGEEFADQHDMFDVNGNVSQNGGKQIDPVNFSRLTSNDRFAAMRRRIFAYVARLIHFRTTTPALGVNEVDFLHMDFNAGKRVLVWSRGGVGNDPVIVVANFSDFASAPGTDYVIPSWPRPTPAGKRWVEVTQQTPPRVVDPAWVGRESIFAWEAKAYTLVPAA